MKITIKYPERLWGFFLGVVFATAVYWLLSLFL